MKPKRGYPRRAGPYDDCDTPLRAWKALELWGGLREPIWEPAPGNGLLVKWMRDDGVEVVATTQDFFRFTQPPIGVRALVTNPPFSRKFEWVEHSLSFGLPVALLLPIEVLGTAAFWVACGGKAPCVLTVTPRLNFNMPNKGWQSSAQFPTAWFAWDPQALGGQIYHTHYDRIMGQPG